MKVFFAQSNVLGFSLMQQWMSDMPKGKREKTKRLRRQQDKELALSAHRLLCYALKKDHGIIPKPDDWGEGENGKPFLVSNTKLHFNLSHSGSIVMCGLHDAPIGVDIERIDEAKDEVAERIMSKEEKDAYFNTKDKKALFYKIWTLKEACIKYSGKGICDALDAITIYPEGEKIRTNVKGCRFTLLNNVPGYQAAVCADSPADNTARWINCDELIDF